MLNIKRHTKITKEELLADVIYFSLSAFISFLIVFLFDIHHSFYSWPIKLKFIFNSAHPYLFFVPIGSILGFFIIKVLIFGIKEDFKD